MLEVKGQGQVTPWFKCVVGGESVHVNAGVSNSIFELCIKSGSNNLEFSTLFR